MNRLSSPTARIAIGSALGAVVFLVLALHLLPMPRQCPWYLAIFPAFAAGYLGYALEQIPSAFARAVREVLTTAPKIARRLFQVLSAWFAEQHPVTDLWFCLSSFIFLIFFYDVGLHHPCKVIVCPSHAVTGAERDKY